MPFFPAPRFLMWMKYCRIDPNLLEWPENDFRIFVGDLGNETNDEVLNKAFARFPTFNKAKVVRDKKTNKTKGTSTLFVHVKPLVGTTNCCRYRVKADTF